MPSLKIMCRPTTPFKATGEMDEDVYRRQLHRLVESKISLFLASGGAGEAFAMSMEEIRRVYEIAVEECKGKVAVYSNSPEQHTAKGAIMHARLAVECGCEAVLIYPPAGWHGYKAPEAEQRAFFDTILSEIKTPVILALNPVLGYTPSIKVMADTARKYHHVVGINVYNEHYLVNLRDLIDRDIDYYFPQYGFLNALTLGATGIMAHHCNIIPKSFRQFIDLCEKREWDKIGPLLAGILRFVELFDRWGNANSRPTKMMMRVLKLPGGEGVLREPNIMPPEDQLKALADGLLRVGLPEIDELARAAGLQ